MFGGFILQTWCWLVVNNQVTRTIYELLQKLFGDVINSSYKYTWN